MGDDWADEEVPMDNIGEQVFVEFSWLICMKFLDYLENLLMTKFSANNHDGRAARG